MSERQAGDETAQRELRAGELEHARRVYGVFVAEASTGLAWGHRVARVAPLLHLTAAKVRRALALHMAPSSIQEMFLEGKLSGRQVECLQGLPEDNQLIVARQLIACRETATHATTVATVACELDRSWGPPLRDWTDAAAEFEGALMRVNETLDDYIDAPKGALLEVFRGAGTDIGRRRIITLIEEQIELLSTMKQTLERAKGGSNGTRAVAAAR